MKMLPVWTLSHPPVALLLTVFSNLPHHDEESTAVYLNTQGDDASIYVESFDDSAPPPNRGPLKWFKAGEDDR